ncbi:kinesin-like protein KIN-12B, partial [Tanacetum coccineum]
IIVFTSDSSDDNKGVSSEGPSITIAKKPIPEVIFKIPITIKGCVLGLANVETWDNIVKKFRMRTPERSADKSKGKRKNETLIVVKAPHGTTLQVPDTDEVSFMLSICTNLNMWLDCTINAITDLLIDHMKNTQLCQEQSRQNRSLETCPLFASLEEEYMHTQRPLLCRGFTGGQLALRCKGALDCVLALHCLKEKKYEENEDEKDDDEDEDEEEEEK